MDDFTHKTIITNPHNLTYSYYLSPNFHEGIKDAATPVLMLLHGFPDDAHMWEGAVPRLAALGYPMLLPDLLGFSGSSKPADIRHYSYRRQASSLAQILDRENVRGKRVIPIGHDWGSATAQRFYLFHRERCVGLSLLSLAYQVPSPNHLSLWNVNRLTAMRFGYPQWSYWEFFTSPDAPELMRLNLERVWEVNNGNFPSPKPEEHGRDIWMRELFCTPNAMREYVTMTGKYENFTVPLKNYPDGERLKQKFIERMSRDGFEGPVTYYHTLVNNTNLEDDKVLCEPGPNSEDKRVINVPVLYIGQTGDWVCRTDLMCDAQELGLVKDLEEKVVEAGHWCLYEKPEAIAEVLAEWLVRRFPAHG